MKPFEFRFADVLSLREAERNARRIEFSTAAAEEARLAEAVAAAQRALDCHHNRRRVGQASPAASVESLVRSEQYSTVLRKQIVQAQAEWRHAAEHATACQQALAMAQREVAALQRLQERDYARYLLDRNRAETRSLDEVAARRYCQAAPAARAA